MKNTPKYTKMLILLASMFHHIFSRVPRGKSYNDILSRQKIEAFGYLALFATAICQVTLILALSYNYREKLSVYR